MLIFVVLGLIICDQPTGAPLFTFSERFTAEDWSLIFNQVAAIQTAGSTVAAIYTAFYDYRETADAMTAAGFSGLVPYVWCKKDHHAVRFPVYNPAVEAMVIGFSPSPADCPWRGREVNPQAKVNYIYQPTIPTSEKKKGEDGQPLNPCEKPAILAKTLARRHCTQGQWAVVLCSGQGGEVLGCLDAGLNVIACDIDPEQMRGLRKTLYARREGFENIIYEQRRAIIQARKEKERQRQERKQKAQEKRKAAESAASAAAVQHAPASSSSSSSTDVAPRAPGPVVAAVAAAPSAGEGASGADASSRGTDRGDGGSSSSEVVGVGSGHLSTQPQPSVAPDPAPSSAPPLASGGDVPSAAPVGPSSAAPAVADTRPRRSSKEAPPEKKKKEKKNKIPKKKTKK